MKKSTLILFSLVFLVSIFSLSIYAQETPTDTTAKTASSTDSTIEADEETATEDLITQAEEFIKDADDFEGTAGFTADDGFLYTLFDGFSESREEKIAEIKETAEKCNAGDTEACTALDIAFEKYKEYAGKFEREVSPEQSEQAIKESEQIRGVLIRDIAKNIDPTKKDEFVMEILEQEEDIGLAAEIATQINELCNKLVGLGEFKKADKVCNLEEDSEESPKWLRDKREGWKNEITSEAQEFLDVLQVCMDVSDDEILGNTESCECDKMPGKNADLCSTIVKLEDACGAGEKNSCGKADTYINDFMEALPEDLRRVMEEQMGEEEFDRSGPPLGCEELDFKECMLQEAEKHIGKAPSECRDALREGIRNGNVKGPKDGQRICQEIMMEGFGSPECNEEGFSPSECADFMSGKEYGGGGRGPGVDFSVCEDIEDHQQRANCYRDNVEKANLAGDYYSEKRNHQGEEFDFEKEFRQQHQGEYVEFYGRDYERKGKFRTEGEAKADFERRKGEHESKIREFVSSCEGAWDCSYGDITPEKPCRCYQEEEFDDIREFHESRGEFRTDFNNNRDVPQECIDNPESCRERFEEFGQQNPQDFSQSQGPPQGFAPGQGFSPPGSPGFQLGEPGQGQEPPSSGSGSSGESSSSSSSSGTTGEGSTTTGGVIWGRITGNAFLDYHWYG